MSRKPAKPAGPCRAAVAVPPLAHPMPVASLPRSRPTPVDIRAEADECAAIAAFLGIEAVRDLRFKGEIVPEERDGWSIRGRLTTIAVQLCVVSLDPVEQKIDEHVVRRYLPEELVGAEVDLDPEAEDDPDPLGDTLDPGHLALEALALALEPYPRAPGAKLVTTQVAPPGIGPMTDEDLKPFAGLAALKAKLSGGKG